MILRRPLKGPDELDACQRLSNDDVRALMAFLTHHERDIAAMSDWDDWRLLAGVFEAMLERKPIISHRTGYGGHDAA